MPHVILLGDSIFDNARYTGGRPDVVSQVRRLLPAGWNASLLAIDGSVTTDIAAQIQRLPQDATHLVLSVGGNDAIMNSSRFGWSLFGFGSAEPPQNPMQALVDVSEEFAKSYRSAIELCLRPGRPLVVCTIYNCCFPDATYQRLVTAGLTVFNNAILNVAIERRLPIIDLRLICSEPGDYANAIEPSSVGGEKIARAIVALVAGPKEPAFRTAIFA